MEEPVEFDAIESLADEFLERSRRGEKPTIDEYCQSYPTLAGEIRDLFPALVMMENAKSAANASPSDLIGAEIPDFPQICGYRVVEEIGRGAMGVVLKAIESATDRTVAIKMLATKHIDDEPARKRFLRESRAAAQVESPHVVEISDVGEYSGHPYFVMECVEGVTLHDMINDHFPLPLGDVASIGAGIAHGLSAAHKKGLVHRDIKPANILIEDKTGQVKITDFGLARPVDDFSLTQSGEIIGTPIYMSPEQAAGDRVDHRSDLYSLGNVLYAMCVGTTPFHDDSVFECLRLVSEDEPRPVAERRPEIPACLASIIDRLLIKDLNKRFQSAAEVAELLDSLPEHSEDTTAEIQVDHLLPPDESESTPSTQKNYVDLSRITYGISFLHSLSNCYSTSLSQPYE